MPGSGGGGEHQDLGWGHADPHLCSRGAAEHSGRGGRLGPPPGRKGTGRRRVKGFWCPQPRPLLWEAEEPKMAVAVAVMFTSAEVQALSNSLVTELGRKGRKGARRRLAQEGRGRDAGPPLPASACPGLPARRGCRRRPPPSPPPLPAARKGQRGAVRRFPGRTQQLGQGSAGDGHGSRVQAAAHPARCGPNAPPPAQWDGTLPTSGQRLKGLQGVFAQDVGVLQPRSNGQRVPQAAAARAGGQDRPLLPKRHHTGGRPVVAADLQV